MQQHSAFSGDFNGSSADDLVEEAATVYLDPRNRLAAQGPEALSDVDCLTLLLGERDYLLASKLLFGFGSLTGVSRASLAQLSAFLTPEKAMRLLAAFRFAALCVANQVAQAPLEKPQTIYDLFATELRQADREILCVALVDARCRLLKKVRVSIGTLNESLAHPREIFKAAISHSAFAFVLVHNHPSGDPAPSESDIRLTRRISDSALILQIRFLDHVIVGQPAADRPPYFSFKESGLLA